MITAKLILTGKETYDPEYSTVSKHDALEAMIEFAKLHVEAALKARDRLYQTHFDELSMMWTEENKKFIINSYPLKNIK